MAIIDVQSREIIEISGEGKYPALGYFEGTIEYASLETSKNGSKTITLNLKPKNEEEWNVIVYNAIRLTNNDGSENFQVNSHLIPMLLTMGIKSFDDEATESTTIKVGKAQSEKVIQAYPALTGKPIACWLKKEYRLWEGKLKENYFITDFFRPKDKASAKEIKNNTEAGLKLNELQAKNETEVYADGLTPDLVAKMRSNSSSKPTESGWNTAATEQKTDEENDDLWD